MIAGQLALTAAALFAGAALYVSFAEQPARLKMDDGAALAEWAPAYKRGFALQGPLAVIGFALGIWAWRVSGEHRWLTGAVLLIANWPYTVICMLKTNKLLLAMTPADAGPESRALMKKWGSLHSVRTALGFAALAMYFYASLAA